MTSRNIKLTVEYNGANWAGWQIQKDQPTVQGALTDAIEAVTGDRVTLYGAGRTDSGVHALGQVANFSIEHSLEPSRYKDALNFHLDDSIRVKQSEEAHEKFHARFDATFRRYRYLVGMERSALFSGLRWEMESDLSIEALREAAQAICGAHDFSPFCVLASRQNNNDCTIYHSRWTRVGRLLIYEIRGNRFLHSMVRSLVGAMLNVAGHRGVNHPGNLTLPRFADIISNPEQTRVPFTAPAHGLYLVSVGYGTEDSA